MRVWQVDLRSFEGRIEDFAGPVLGEDEMRRGGEALDVWRRRVIARAALRVALGIYLDRPPDSLVFALGPGGRPELAGDPAGASFSLSRAGELCLIAICEEGPVGIDVEEVRDVPELASLVRSRFAASEATAILERSGKSRLRAFYRCWTRKEAYLKAVGTGVGAGLERVVVSVDEHPALLAAPGAGAGEWSLLDLGLEGDFAGAVAVRGAVEGAPYTLIPKTLPISA